MSDFTKKPLSYSAYSTYMICPKKYALHYIERIRPASTPIHLVFGSAVDKALNALLEGDNYINVLGHAHLEMQKLFDLRHPVDFEAKDFDSELLTEETIVELKDALSGLGWKGDDVGALAADLFQKRQFGETLSDNQVTALKWLVYFSSCEKAKLIVDAFEKHVRPQIEEIVSVQTNVKRGILDFKARLKGYDGIIVCDNKTSARPYDSNAVKVSVQLAGYGAETGAYIVFNKNVVKNRTKVCSACGANGTGKRHKTCDAIVTYPPEGADFPTRTERCNGEWTETIAPEIIPQIIVDKIPERNRVMVEEAYIGTEQLIEAAQTLIGTGVFPRNFSACGKQFGARCPYIDLCWDGSMKGLVKLEDKETK